MKRWLVIVLGGLLLLFGVGYFSHQRGYKSGVASVLITEHIDTCYLEKPVPVIEYRDSLRYIPVPYAVHDTADRIISDTVRVRDTVYINLPMEVKQFADELYRCQVSGYHPSLDWIEVYSKTDVITQQVKSPYLWDVVPYVNCYSPYSDFRLGFSAGVRMPIYLNGIYVAPGLGYSSSLNEVFVDVSLGVSIRSLFK